jgi:hypothetical protein
LPEDLLDLAVNHAKRRWSLPGRVDIHRRLGVAGFLLAH